MPIEVRACSDADVAGVAALIEDRIGAEDAPEALLVLNDPAYDRTRWSVAVDRDRVVSTMGTYPMDIRLGVAEVPGALVEFVATDRDYEGRGLIRSQFDYHHADLDRRGELFQAIVGITYFYRRLGYEYALPVAPWQSIPSEDIRSMPADWIVRAAEPSDIPLILDLQRRVQDLVDLSVGLSSQMWSFLLRSPVYETLIAEHEGDAQACGRVYMDEDAPFLMDLVGTSAAGLRAVLSEVAARCPEQTVTNLTRPGSATNLDGLGISQSTGEAYYARVGDPVRWLNAVRPELNRRLRASDFAAREGQGLISMYSSSITFTYKDGEITEFAAGPGEPSPISKGGSGVPPDLMTSLLVGPLGFAGLAHRNPDVNAGRQEELMDVLFPPLTLDIQSWVVP